MAFGTGHHGTTKGCLLALDKLISKGKKIDNVIDIGCGTAVLAMAVGKVSSSEIIASDERATISFDAQSSVSASEGVSLRVKKHENFVHLIHPKGYDYFEIIRSKLHWGQKV